MGRIADGLARFLDLSDLEPLTKAKKGEQSAQHKYVRRVPKPGGGYKYIYSDAGTAHRVKQGERINLKQKGVFDVVSIHGSTIKIRNAETGRTDMVHMRDLHNKMLEVYHHRMFKGAERMAMRVMREAQNAGLGKLDLSSDKAAAKSWEKVREHFKKAGVDDDHAKHLLGWVAERKGWGDDAKSALVAMATSKRWRRFVAPSGRAVGRGAENLAKVDGAKKVEPKHVVAAVHTRFGEDKPSKSAGENVERLRAEADADLAKLEALVGAAQHVGNDEHAARALALHAKELADAESIAALQTAAQAYPGIRDAPELERWRKVKGAVTALFSRFGHRPKRDGGKGVPGAEVNVYIADETGKPVPQKARYRLVEANDAIPSHDPRRNFQPHADYPEGVQERVYHRDKEEQRKVLRNAERLLPDLVVNTNPDAANGPPVMTRDGVVLGGNSRTMSLQLVHDRGGDRAAAYVQHLKQNAQQFGFEPDDVEGMKNPILVREVDAGEAGQKELGVLARRYNEAFTQAMDPRTDQVARARLVSDNMLDTLGHHLDAKKVDGTSKHKTLNAFLSHGDARDFIDTMQKAGIIDDRNRSMYLRRDGSLNEDGKQFVERLLVGKIIPHPDTLADMPPSQIQALSQSVPHMIRAQQSGHDIQGSVMDAVRAYAHAQPAAGNIERATEGQRDELAAQGPCPGFTEDVNVRRGNSGDHYVPPKGPVHQRDADLQEPLGPEDELPQDVLRFPNGTDKKRGLLHHQADGAARIVRAWRRGHGVLVQDDTGMGKSITALASIAASGGTRNLIVVPTKGKHSLKGQWGEGAALYGIDVDPGAPSAYGEGTWVVSYEELYDRHVSHDLDGRKRVEYTLKPEFTSDNFDTVVFDECHSMRNPGSATGRMGVALQDHGKNVLYMSATPYTNVVDMHYMRRLGWFNDGRSFMEWAEEMGASVNYEAQGPGDIPHAVENPASPLPLAAIAAVAHVEGRTLNRESSMEGSTSRFRVRRREDLPPDAHKTFEIAEDIAELAKAAMPRSLVKAWFTQWTKGYWETLKVDQAIETGRKALQDNPHAQLAFFTSYKTYEHNWLHAFRRYVEKKAMRAAEMDQHGDSQHLHDVAADIQELIERLPPITNPVDRLVREFGGPEHVAGIYGGAAVKDAKQEQRVFQAGAKRVLVATMAKGGTGLSFHDTNGDAPRVQINLSLPYSGREFTQVSGRTYRIGSKSDAEMVWLVGDDDYERKNASAVSARLKNAGALTSGDEEMEASAAYLANWALGQDIDQEEFTKVSPEEVEEGADKPGQTEGGQAVRDYFRQFAEQRYAGRDVFKEEAQRRADERRRKADREVRRAAAQLEGEGLKLMRLGTGRYAVFGRTRQNARVIRKVPGATFNHAYLEWTLPDHEAVVLLAQKMGVGRQDVSPIPAEDFEATKNPAREQTGARGTESQDHLRAGRHDLVLREGTREGMVAVRGNTYPVKDVIKDAAFEAGARAYWNRHEKHWEIPSRVVPDVLDALDDDRGIMTKGETIVVKRHTGVGFAEALRKATQFDMFGEHQQVDPGDKRGGTPKPSKRQASLDFRGTDRPKPRKGGPPGSGWQPVAGSKHGAYRRRHGNEWEYWYPKGAHHQYPHGGKAKPGALVRGPHGYVHKVTGVVGRGKQAKVKVDTPRGPKAWHHSKVKVHKEAHEAGGGLLHGVPMMAVKGGLFGSMVRSLLEGDHEPMRKAMTDRPPPGFTPVPKSRKGGFRKRVGNRWVYWYPGQGTSTTPHPEESHLHEEPSAAATGTIEHMIERSLAEYEEKHGVLEKGTKTLDPKELERRAEPLARRIQKVNAARNRRDGLPEDRVRWREGTPGIDTGGELRAYDFGTTRYKKPPPPTKDKPWPPARKAMHNRIVAKFTESVAPAGPDETPVAYVMMGGPGSGKSSITKGIDRSEFVNMDSDEVKGHIPEYHLARAAQDKQAAAVVHAESSEIAKRIRDHAIERRKPLIMDGTGKDAKKYAEQIDRLKSKGYHVIVLMPHISKTEGLARVKERAEKTGRYVPDKVVKAAYDTIPGNFERLARLADEAKLYDNSGPKGSTPDPIVSYDNGEPIVHNEAKLAHFREHGGAKPMRGG